MSIDKKIKKLRIWITEKGKTLDKKKKVAHEQSVTDLTKPFEFDVYTDFVGDGDSKKKKVTDFTVTYDGDVTPPPPPTDKPPVAKARSDKTTAKPKDTVTLDGSQSSSPSGIALVTYDWSQYSGTNVNLVFNSSVSTATFIAPEVNVNPPPPPPPPITGDFPVPTTWYYDSKEVTNKPGKMTSSSYYPNPDSVCLPSGASGAKNHKVTDDGWIQIDTGGGNGRIYWDYAKLPQMNADGFNTAFAGTFKLLAAENLSIKDGNHGTDGSKVVEGMVFGGFGLSFHEAQVESKQEYWHNEQGKEVAFAYPNGQKIDRNAETKFYLTLTTNTVTQEVILNVWLDFAKGKGWERVMTNRRWAKDSSWTPGSVPSGSDKADILKGPSFIKRHHIWTRSNTGSCSIKDVKIGIPNKDAALFAINAVAATSTDPNILGFTLKVTDTKGLSGTDNVSVIVAE